MMSLTASASAEVAAAEVAAADALPTSVDSANAVSTGRASSNEALVGREAPDPMQADRDRASPLKTHVAVRGAGGGAMRALFDSMVIGGEAKVSVGIDAPYGEFALTIAMFGGEVEGGFLALHPRVGIDVAWPVDIVRIGFEPRIGYLGISRLTSERQFGAYTFGLAARVTVDLHRGDGVAWAIGAEPAADIAAALGNDGQAQDSAAPLIGASAFLEVRWRGN